MVYMQGMDNSLHITFYRKNNDFIQRKERLNKVNIMKRLNVTVQCMAVYNSSIEVPDNMTLEEAIEYAKKHLAEIPCGELEYISDSDELDEENCDFEE